MKCVFIGGYLRTGTTLLQNILCSAPQTHAMIREAVLLGDLLESFRRSLTLFDEHSCDYFEDRAALRTHMEGLVRAHLQHVHQRLEAPEFLVLKRPQMTLHLPLLHVLQPQARFIVMIRDPRDVVASALEAIERGAQEFSTRDPARIAESMRAYTTNCTESRLPGFRENCLYLRYEDLVSQPEAAHQLLGEFTGIALDSSVARAGARPGRVDYDSDAQVDRPLHSPLYGRAMSTGRIGNYKKVLTPSQVAAVEEICAPIMERFGYRASA